MQSADSTLKPSPKLFFFLPKFSTMPKSFPVRQSLFFHFYNSELLSNFFGEFFDFFVIFRPFYS